MTKVTSKPVLVQVKGHRIDRIEIEEGLDFGWGYCNDNIDDGTDRKGRGRGQMREKDKSAELGEEGTGIGI